MQRQMNRSAVSKIAQKNASLPPGQIIRNAIFTMETIKQRQTAETIKRHFSIVLQEEGGYIYGREVMVTVTQVRMTPDLSLAKIYLSVYNTENKQAPILELQEEQQRLRQALAHRVRKQMRRVPDIAFFLDDTLDEMYRVDELFNRLHREGQMGKDEEE